jgi:hypothetical protein
MYGSSNSQRSSSSVPENISSSSINTDQGQEEQSRTQEEKVESTSLENQTVRFPKPENPILAEPKLPWLKRKIAPHQVLTMMMMTLMMNMIMKSS